MHLHIWYLWQQTRAYCYYTPSLKLKLVRYLVFNRHENFTSVILLRMRGFHFGIALSGVEQCDDKQWFSWRSLKTLALSSGSSTPESAIPKWKPLFLFLSKITKAAKVKVSCLLNTRWQTCFNWSKSIYSNMYIHVCCHRYLIYKC